MSHCHDSSKKDEIFAPTPNTQTREGPHLAFLQPKKGAAEEP